MSKNIITLIVNGDCSKPLCGSSDYTYIFEKDGKQYSNTDLDWHGWDGGISLDVMLDFLKFLGFDVFLCVKE